MPTYDYKCDACGHAFEQFQSITAEPIRKCPQCGKMKVKRLIGTGAGLIFKGSGFYITDYRDQSYKDKAKADSGTAETKAGGGNGDAAKSDSSSAAAETAKPATAAEAKSAAPATPAKSEPKPAAKGSSKKK